MAEQKRSLSDFPKRLKRSTQTPDRVYLRATDFYAVRGTPVQAERDVPVLTVNADNGESIRVYRGVPKQTRAVSGSPSVTPVYSLPSAESVVVPTGRVFVRFADSIKAETKADELKKAGYKIVQTLVYAPNAAWLEATNGDIAMALNNIEKLAELADVENVEPQLLAPRALK
ncbi:MAG TPA: hypothetical protein VGX03_31545 [Candidatus Binatia bacterium]|jgi:hypothetical protein|nr:hypothetical protein [Candidatus Binatia bacterium]